MARYLNSLEPVTGIGLSFLILSAALSIGLIPICEVSQIIKMMHIVSIIITVRTV